MLQLILSLAVFIGTHFLMSHPLRARLVTMLGNGGFAIAYSLVALASFAWIIIAFRAAPITDPLWMNGDVIWIIATLMMWDGSVLFAGSLLRNPALPRPDAADLAKAPVSGVFAITRHPMMWGFTLWGLVHIMVSGQPRSVILALGMIILALGGSAGQDRKKAVLMGADWQGWASRTSFWPCGLQASGRASWKTLWPGSTTVLAGTVLWLAATKLHPWFGAPMAGIFHWFG